MLTSQLLVLDVCLSD
ncbi:hypothetical protein DLR72_09410, partial [Vibrio paracholerae]